MSTPIAEVILDQALDRPLDYAIPNEFSSLEIGMRVEVPLRGKTAKGTILALKDKSAFSQLKPLSKILHELPLISSELFALAKWVSSYYCCPLSKVMKAILPPMIRGDTHSHKKQAFIRPLLSKNQLQALCIELRGKHPQQATVLDLLLTHHKGLFLTQFLEESGLSMSPVKTLEKKGTLQIEKVQIDRNPVFSYDFFPTKPKTLSNEQRDALKAIINTKGQFQVHLIQGVTGSGKTEVYLQAIQHLLDDGFSILYLIPEISLTSQTIERFRGRFPDKEIAIYHHRLSDGERFDAWHNIQQGKAQIIIGARSAVFMPVQKLGLIIVDEEHEASYKQSEETPKYNGRDVAIVRGKLANCPVILGSATPSLESYTNAIDGKYHLHFMKSRPNNATLPKVHIVDMKREMEREKGFCLFSNPLIRGMQSRFEKGEQTLLFLNRRGYHTAAVCPDCTYVEKCPDCDLTLTYHRGSEILSCHLCDYQKAVPRHCPSCQKEGPLKFKGFGTQLVEKTLQALFPGIRTLRLDADTTKHKGSHEKIFKQFRSGKADVLIGTQMIAKGLHLPMVTLVGVIGIDGSLNIPDFRSSEMVFQLLTQVAGRSGRADLPGEVIIQTHIPTNTTIVSAAKQDYEEFYNEEMEIRQLFSFPPLKRLIKITFAGQDLQLCQKFATNFRQQLMKALPKQMEILPLVPCGYAKIKGQYRFQFILKGEKINNILPTLMRFGKDNKGNKNIRLSIDIDPLTTFF